MIITAIKLNENGSNSTYSVAPLRFDFSVEPYELSSKSLELTVKDYKNFISKVEIAVYSLTLANVNIGKPETKW